jgi:predicted nucleic acid-binding protein
MVVVVDASVWVAAADATDAFSESSRAFLLALAERAAPIALPDFAELEVACALARRLGDAERGRELAARLPRAPLVTMHPLALPLARRAIEVGTARFLRAGDALYVTVAEVIEGEVVTWDEELIQRAGALTPPEWMERYKKA